MSARAIWAVVPVKAFAAAKARLSPLLSPPERQALARAMLEDVLATLARAPGLAGILVATEDAEAALLAQRHGADVFGDDAGAGHSAAVAAAARALARSGAAMLTVPADIPLVLPSDIAALVAADQGFTIAPSAHERGSNAVLCAPADAVPLRFGDDSFAPHLAAARARGIAPVIVRRPRIALDIDRPEDVAAFLAIDQPSRARAVLESFAALRPQEVT